MYLVLYNAFAGLVAGIGGILLVVLCFTLASTGTAWNNVKVRAVLWRREIHDAQITVVNSSVFGILVPVPSGVLDLGLLSPTTFTSGARLLPSGVLDLFFFASGPVGDITVTSLNNFAKEQNTRNIYGGCTWSWLLSASPAFPWSLRVPPLVSLIRVRDRVYAGVRALKWNGLKR